MKKNGQSVPEVIKGYFAAYGSMGGKSRSKKKVAAARINAAKAAASRKKS